MRALRHFSMTAATPAWLLRRSRLALPSIQSTRPSRPVLLATSCSNPLGGRVGLWAPASAVNTERTSAQPILVARDLIRLGLHQARCTATERELIVGRL